MVEPLYPNSWVFTLIVMPRKVTVEDVEALAIGGTILGGGGGGWPEEGRAAGKLAMELGGIELWSPEETPREWNVITIAALGAPTQKGETKARHFIRAVQMLWEAGVEFDGVIAAENGGHNSFGGWIPAAALGLPVVDIPGDGRAHPTAMMGSMGIHRIDYNSVKAGATEGAEMVSWGTLQRTSNQIRFMAGDCKALIAMARDPISVEWCLEHGAPGAIQQAIDLGKAYLKAKKGEAAVKAAAKFLGGELKEKGKIVEMMTEARGGFDVGMMTIKGERTWELGFVNEYMTMDSGGKRLATFPDLITTFNAEGDPVTSAALKQGDGVYLVNVPKESIKVGDGNRYPEIYEPVEKALGKPMVKYLKGYLKQ
jgi:uncharacterized protein